MIRIDAPQKKLLMPFFVLIVIIFVPFAAISGLIHIVEQRFLAKRMLKEWASHEKYILLCYYDGSLWRNYLEKEILPKYDKHIIVMNWSEDSSQQVDEKYAELAHKVFDKYLRDYDYLSPEIDEDMRCEYQVAVAALCSDGKVNNYSTYPMTPQEIIKYESKMKGKLEKVIADCLVSWKV